MFVLDAGIVGGYFRKMPQDAQHELSAAEVAAAIRFNRRLPLPAEAWAQIAVIIGASSTDMSSELVGDELVGKLAIWQRSKNLDGDGKIGNFTLQWMSQQPGGDGLEDYVDSDATIYLGMNPKARDREARTLTNRAGQHAVTPVLGSRRQDSAALGDNIGAATADVTSAAGQQAFAASLAGIDAVAREQIAQFLADSGRNTRDELAQLIRLLHAAESGQRLIKRVVLSGHSAGWSIVGEDPNLGTIRFQHLAGLATIFPNAAGQVEDLMLSACNTGQKSKLVQYTAIFPNLKSIWAYVGYSPTVPGSSQHIAAWEAASRGPMNPASMHAGRQRIARRGGRNDKNVLVWTRDHDGRETYDTESMRLDYHTLRALVDDELSHFHSAFNDGIIAQSALNELYTKLQNLVGNYRSHLRTEADDYERVMKQTLFLRHWSKVTHEFMKEYGHIIESAYRAAFTPMPPYATASRNQALQDIAAYPGLHDNHAHRLLQDYLRDLKPDLIPDTWF